MIGVPISYNLALVPTDNVSGMDAEILIQLNDGHRPSGDYMRTMRDRAARRLPGLRRSISRPPTSSARC